jgi:hypothetical protein
VVPALEVLEMRDCPSVTVVNPGRQSNYDGDSVDMAITASTTTGHPLTYSATGLPAGLSINFNTGVISGALAATADLYGPYTATVTADDSFSTASQTFGWDAFNPVRLPDPGLQVDTNGDNVLLPLEAPDASGASVTYSATGLPTGLSIDSQTGEISGTLASPTTGSSAFNVTVTATDGTHTTQQSFSWLVSDPIALTGSAAETPFRDGDAVSLALGATDSAGGTLSFSATGLPTGLSIDAATGAITGTLTSNGGNATSCTTTVTATDGTYSATLSIGWTINDPVSESAPGNQANYNGDTVSLPISASDSTSATLSYSASGLPTGLTIESATGVISGTLATDATAGSLWSVAVTASDGSSSAVRYFTWTVNDPVSLADPGNQVSTNGDTVSLSLNASTTTSSGLTFSATDLPAGLTLNATTGVISGTIATATDGPYVAYMTVSATDGTYSASRTMTWRVNDPVNLTNPGLQSNEDGDTVSLQISASTSTTGTLSYSATGLPSGLSMDAGTGVISGTIANNADTDSPYLVTVTATDGTFAASETFAWAVAQANNATPVRSYVVTTLQDTHAVNPGNSPLDAQGKISLRSAIEDANTRFLAGQHALNRITFSSSLSGTILLTSALEELRTDFDIRGHANMDIAITRSLAPGLPKFGLFDIDTAGPDRRCYFSNLTLSNGRSTAGGGAINAMHGALFLSDMQFTGNAARFGGAVLNREALYASDSFFFGNGAAVGGAIDNRNGASATLLKCSLKYNVVTMRGGAIDSYSPTGTAGGLTLTNTSVCWNRQLVVGFNFETAGGGGICVQGVGSTFTMTGGSLFGNVADGDNSRGGGLWSGGTSYLTNVRIVSNSAPIGGGVFAFAGLISLNSCLITTNTVEPGGAGTARAWAFGALVTWNNCTFNPAIDSFVQHD